eukprot:COSAG01_NODE_3482_length_6022_cov_61.122235_5_plen_79_part_00
MRGVASFGPVFLCTPPRRTRQLLLLLRTPAAASQRSEPGLACPSAAVRYGSAGAGVHDSLLPHTAYMYATAAHPAYTS